MIQFIPHSVNPAADQAETFIATGTAALLALSAGATATGSIVAAQKGSSAATKSARLQTEAANRAAEIQSQSAREALDFQKAEAARNQAVAEQTRHANYDQWAAEQRRRGTLGQLLGLGPPEIPGYVPIEGAPGTLGAALPQTGANRATAASGAPTMPAGGDYQTWFNGLIAGKPFNQQTLLDLEPTLNQAGVQLTPPNAVGDRTKIRLPTGQWVRVGFGEGKPVWVVQPGTNGASPMGQAGTPGTLGAALPYQARVLTPPLQAPQVPYRPGTLGYSLMG